MRLFCFRSNVLGTKFTVYDGGENPEKKPFVKESESVRQELAAICYVSPNFLCPFSIPQYIKSQENFNEQLVFPVTRRQMFWDLRVPGR